MKKYNATLTITSVINSDEADKIEFVTDGAFYFKNNAYYILYDEKEEMGMANCSVTIKVSDSDVVISRKGEFSSKLVYKESEASEFLYNTPYGKFPVILTTEKITNSLNVMGGKIEILYGITISNEENFHSLTVIVKTN